MHGFSTLCVSRLPWVAAEWHWVPQGTLCQAAGKVALRLRGNGEGHLEVKQRLRTAEGAELWSKRLLGAGGGRSCMAPGACQTQNGYFAKRNVHGPCTCETNVKDIETLEPPGELKGISFGRFRSRPAGRGPAWGRAACRAGLGGWGYPGKRPRRCRAANGSFPKPWLPSELVSSKRSVAQEPRGLFIFFGQGGSTRDANGTWTVWEIAQQLKFKAGAVDAGHLESEGNPCRRDFHPSSSQKAPGLRPKRAGSSMGSTKGSIPICRCDLCRSWVGPW